MPGTPRKVDFSEYLQRPGTRVEAQFKSPETPEEIQSRLRQQEAEAKHQRTKDWYAFLAGLISLASVGGVCLWIAAGPHSSPDDRKWATGILTSIVTLWAGYLAGKSQGSR
jgi:cation transport ATPase